MMTVYTCIYNNVCLCMTTNTDNKQHSISQIWSEKSYMQCRLSPSTTSTVAMYNSCYLHISIYVNLLSYIIHWSPCPISHLRLSPFLDHNQSRNALCICEALSTHIKQMSISLHSIYPVAVSLSKQWWGSLSKSKVCLNTRMWFSPFTHYTDASVLSLYTLYWSLISLIEV